MKATDNHMVTVEEHKDGTTVVTILDDRGHDADLEVHFKPGGATLCIRQLDVTTGGSDLIVVSPLQALFLRELLNDILKEETPSVPH